MENDTLFFQKLGKQSRKFRKLCAKATFEKREADYGYIYDTAAYMCDLSTIAKNTGLLALEEDGIKHIPDGGERKGYIKFLIMLVVDGTDPQLIEEMSWCTYCSKDYNVAERLSFLIALRGMLLIQEGVNPRVMDEYMWVMLPEKIRQLHQAGEKRWHHFDYPSVQLQQSKKQGDEAALRRQYGKASCFVKGEPKYILKELSERILSYCDDLAVQKILSKLHTGGIVNFIYGLDGDERKRVLINMPREEAVAAARHLQFMESVPSSPELAAEGMRAVFEAYVSLIDASEIPFDPQAYGVFEPGDFRETLVTIINAKRYDLDSFLEEIQRKTNI